MQRGCSKSEMSSEMMSLVFFFAISPFRVLISNVFTSSSVGSDLIVSILGDVSNPWQSLVSTFLDDLEIPDLDS